ncbi:MAG: outer membrane protein assembly factor BamB family protein [Pirellulales bacterium]
METIAVVPIFTTAGAALAPMILAALASLAALALKPRELLRLGREKPAWAATALGTVALVLAATWLWAAGASAGSGARLEPRAVARCDWAKVAEDLIALERVGKAPTTLTSAAPVEIPLVLGHDFARGSYAGGPSPEKLKPLWSFRPQETMFLSSPAVAGKRVFAAGCQAELGGYSGLLACLDFETGKPLWQVTEANGEALFPFFSSPALTRDGKYLVIGQGLHADRDCSLLCVEAATGRFRWAVKTPLHIESSPALFGDVAVVGAGAIEGPDGRPGGDPGFVLAVRIADGKELWRQTVNDPESSPAVDDNGTVYIGSGFNGSAVVAIRGDAEEQLRAKKLDRIAWRTPVAQPILSAVTLAGELVIAGGGNSDAVHSNQNAQGLVVALDRATGAIRWQRPLGDSVLGPIAFREGLLLCPSRTGEVTALSLADGEVRWRARVSGTAPVLAGCALAGRRVYAVSNDGYLAVLDAADGKVLEKTHLNDPAKPGMGLGLSSPRIAGGRVVVGSETGGLRCLVGSEGQR